MSGLQEGVRFEDWVGRVERVADTASAYAPAALAALLDQPSAGAAESGAFETGAALAPLRHWLYGLPLVAQSGLGPDGHPKRGGFLPPIPLERRMWAGGRLRFFDDIRVGDALSRRSEIISVSQKDGRAGLMAFVTVRHEIETPRGRAVEEEQDIVYLAMPKAFAYPPASPVLATPDWVEAFPVDPVKLFRFSAVTFNAHRIHYDLDYARNVEAYPGLVVHGPLQAIALLDFARAHAPGRRVAAYTFRGVRPAFDFDAIRLLGAARAEGCELQTAVGEAACMQASVTWA